MLMTKRFKRTVKTDIAQFVYGATDGTITTFAVIAGARGGNLDSKVALILGFANLFADGFSMGVSSFLGEESERPKGNMHKNLVKSLVTFMSFIAVGTLPLIAYVLEAVGSIESEYIFTVTSLSAAFAFVMIGILRAVVTKTKVLTTVLQTLLLGSAAAVIAYIVGDVIESIVK